MKASDFVDGYWVGIDPATVEVRYMGALIRSLVPPTTAAMCLPWAVYIRPPFTLPPLVMLHELVHMRQWRELGVIRFLYIYLSEYLAARKSGLDHQSAYRGISLELMAWDEAYEALHA